MKLQQLWQLSVTVTAMGISVETMTIAVVGIVTVSVAVINPEVTATMPAIVVSSSIRQG